jgi:hypothetical protein
MSHVQIQMGCTINLQTSAHMDHSGAHNAALTR